MWTWRPTLSKIKINTAGRLYFVCTCLYRSLFRLYLKQLNKKWKIKNGQRATLKFFKFHLCHSKENRLYSFVPLLLSFVPQRVRRYSAFQFLRNSYIANLTNFKDIEMGPMAFERKSFVPVCTSITFVCTSKGSEIQRVSDFAQLLYSANLANFKDIEMGPMAFERESFVSVCTSITFVCTSKGSEIQRFQNIINASRG